MSARATKKAAASSAYPAARGLFEQLVSLFDYSSRDKKPRRHAGQLDASLEALKQAPLNELAAVSQVLQEISARVDKLNANLASMNAVRQCDPCQPSTEDEKSVITEDSIFQEIFARAPEESVENKPTTEQKHANPNAKTMSKLRQESAAAL